MLEFTISLKDSAVEFSPLHSERDLALLLPPTARIEPDDNVLLDPIPVHSFFNAISFGRWLAQKWNVSDTDGILIYALHDILKSFLRFVAKEDGTRNWYHSYDMFDELKAGLKTLSVFDDFETSFDVVVRHMSPELQKSHLWREATWHERGFGLAPKTATAAWEFPTPSIGLSVRLNPCLSNIFAIEHIKSLFISAYADALRFEYAAFFNKIDEITYRYEFIDPAKLSGDTDRDINDLALQSNVSFKNKRLVIHTPIGAVRPSEVDTDEQTHIRVPFWLLLTIHADATGIIFPIPSLPDDSPNTAFVQHAKGSFHRGVEKLLDQVPSTGRHWTKRKQEILEHLHETLVVADGKYESVRASLAASTVSDAVCNLCGSNVSPHFLCSPEKDLGWSTSHYTDWHQGNIGSACALCAISNFKVPPKLEAAYSLVKQKKFIYLSVTTPNINEFRVRFENATRKSVLPFFDAPILPKLVISSLESLVTLNLIGALFLRAGINASCVEVEGTRELWLKPIDQSNPFNFVGEIGKRQSKRKVDALLRAMHEAFNRKATLLDPMMSVDIEIPFANLTCIMGNTQGKHYELKFKPMLVSNKNGTIAVVCDGYHLVDTATLDAIEQIHALIRTLRGKGVSDSMKISALASSPGDLIEVMTATGGCNIETTLQNLRSLASGESALVYLERLRDSIHRYPLVTELWR